MEQKLPISEIVYLPWISHKSFGAVWLILFTHQRKNLRDDRGEAMHLWTAAAMLPPRKHGLRTPQRMTML
jgi:hypothetical protein